MSSLFCSPAVSSSVLTKGGCCSESTAQLNTVIERGNGCFKYCSTFLSGYETNCSEGNLNRLKRPLKNFFFHIRQNQPSWLCSLFIFINLDFVRNLYSPLKITVHLNRIQSHSFLAHMLKRIFFFSWNSESNNI